MFLNCLSCSIQLPTLGWIQINRTVEEGEAARPPFCHHPHFSGSGWASQLTPTRAWGTFSTGEGRARSHPAPA